MPQHHHRLLRLLSLPLLALAAHAAQAADAPSTPAAATTQPALITPPEPKVERIVLEDDSTRIEELKVRGQTQTAKVTPKDSKLPSYEIILPDGSRDMSSGSTTRGAAGKRVWKLFSF
ncbi:hypothetical protein J7U46_14170 [Pelomonas sp. V22]|uniref:DUF2782 domain-containing protein n=1 Tax=Pelomonas sp. V22 TaxID=2822139 RepID=UPI0024A92DA4|nr:DUF2782 domain-containing protein [Pelomonas sp. V22]MDI4634200.1 hypothetical protein [Pelomonas sp. V22]